MASSESNQQDAATDLRYDAFISYSHAADQELATAIERGLRSLAKRWNQRRALNVALDRTVLTASAGLWTEIAEKIDRSRYFILLASPESAQSEYVAREVEHWTSTSSAEKILLVLTDGDLRWDSNRGDFDWATSTVPPALEGVFREEPRHIDMRWARDETDLSLRHSRFRDQIAELAAPIHGVSKSDLEGEDVRQYRRTRRLRRLGIGVILTLAVGVFAGFLVAVRNADEAERQAAAAVASEKEALAAQGVAEAEAQRADAEAQRADAEAQRALARALASQAELLAHEPDLQMLLHRAAIDTDPDPFNQHALIRTLSARHLVGFWRPERPPGQPLRRHVAVDEAGERVVFTGEDGVIEVWDLASRQRLVRDVVAIDVVDGSITIAETLPERSIPLEIVGVGTPFNESVVLHAFTGQVLAWDPDSGLHRLLATDCSTFGTTPVAVALSGSAAVTCFGPAEEGHGVLDGDYYLRVAAHDGTTLRIPLPRGAVAVDIAPDGGSVAVALEAEPQDLLSPLSTIAVFDLEEFDVEGGALLRSITVRTGGAATLRFSPDARLLAVGGLDGSVQLIDVSPETVDGSEATSLIRIVEHAAQVGVLAFDSTGELLVTGDAAGGMATWLIRGDSEGPSDAGVLERLASFTAHGTELQAIQVSDSESWVSIGRDGVGWWSHPGPVARSVHTSSTTWALVSLGDGSLVFPATEGLMRFLPEGDEQPHLWIPLDYSVTRLAASGERIAGGSSGVDIWNAQTGEHLRSIEGVEGFVSSISLSPDGTLIAIGSHREGGHSYFLYEVDSGRQIHTFPGAVDAFGASAFSPGQRVLAYPDGNSVKLLDIERLEVMDEIHVGQRTEAIAFSPDGRLLALGTGRREGSVRLYEVDPDGGPPVEVHVYADPSAGVLSLAFDPNGRVLVGGTWDRRTFVVDVESRQRVAFLGDGQAIQVIAAAAFTEPNVYAVAGSGGVTVYDWRLESLISAACSVAGRDLTEEERERFGLEPDFSVCQ